jgi:hypothetical protein
MKHLVVFLAFCSIVSAPSAFGQDHVAVGAYADYFRVSQTDTNSAGLGARLGFGLTHHLMLEAEMSYDFEQTFTESFSGGTTVTVQRSSLRLLHGLFGPKLALGHSNFHPFVTVKGGFLKTSLHDRPANLATFFSSVDNLRSKDPARKAQAVGPVCEWRGRCCFPAHPVTLILRCTMKNLRVNRLAPAILAGALPLTVAAAARAQEPPTHPTPQSQGGTTPDTGRATESTLSGKVTKGSDGKFVLGDARKRTPFTLDHQKLAKKFGAKT